MLCWAITEFAQRYKVLMLCGRKQNYARSKLNMESLFDAWTCIGLSESVRERERVSWQGQYLLLDEVSDGEKRRRGSDSN